MTRAALAIAAFKVGDIIEINSPASGYHRRAGRVVDAVHLDSGIFLDLALFAFASQPAQDVRMHIAAVRRVTEITATTTGDAA